MVAVVNVNHARVQGLFTAGADADDFLKHYQSVFMQQAFKAAPSRATFALKRGHRMGGRLNSGPYQRRAIVNNTVPYAPYVHNGTQGPITPKKRPYLVVRAAPFSDYEQPTRRRSVQGQEENPWMVRAGVAADRITASYRKR